jgi:nitrate reductase NapD
MNISSIVVSTLDENSEEVINHFKAGDFCEFHHYENGKIIVTIEGDDVSEEIAKLRMIENTPHVISASMVYSYCEDELESEKEKIQKFGDFPEWLNDENLDAKKIRYSGNLKNYGV